MRHAERGGAGLVILLILIVLLLGAGGAAFAYHKGYLDLSGTGLDEILNSVGLSPASAPSTEVPQSQSVAPTPTPSTQVTVGAVAATAPASQTLPASGPLPLQPEATPKVTLTISSDPEEVEIYVDGEFVGVAPLPVMYPRDATKTVTLTFKKEGYIDAEQKITLERDVPIIARLTPVSEAARPKEPVGALSEGASVKAPSGKTSVNKNISQKPTQEDKTRVKSILEGRSQ